MKIYTYLFSVLLMSGTLVAQNFENNGGTYEASCTAVLRVLDNGANDAFTGSDIIGSVDPIEGIVDYAQDDGTDQTVQSLNYSRLFLSGGENKNVPDGIIVHGNTDYDAACDLSDLTGGTYAELVDYPYAHTFDPANNFVQYTGEFTYAPGDTATQNIYPDNYADLVIAEPASGTGTANILTEDVVTADKIDSDPSTAFTISGTGSIETGGSNSLLEGTVAIADDGSFTGGAGEITFDNTVDLTENGLLSSGAGQITFNDPTTLNGSGATISLDGNGDLVFSTDVTVTEGEIAVSSTGAGGGTLIFDGSSTVDLVGDNSVLSVADGGAVEIGGSISNGSTDGTNFQLASCNTFVTYNGVAGQEIMPATTDNSYGNLTLTGDNKVGGSANYGNDVAICADLTVDEINVAMSSTTTYGGNSGNDGAIIMTDAGSDIAFNNDNGEIIGKVSRTGFNSGDQYFFNNAFTYATFQDIPDASFTLNIEPNTEPTQINYDNTGDYFRKVEVSYSSTTDITLQNLAIGYEYDEVPNAGAQDQVRLVEGDDVNNRGQLVGAAGASIGLSGTATSASGEYASVLFDEDGSGNYLTFPESGTSPGTPDEVYSGNSLVMTTAPVTLISLRNGRWSDPGTWGGVTPTSQDHAQVAHVVYTGIYGQNNDGTEVFGNPAHDVNEQDLPGVDAGVIASYVEVDPNDASGSRSVAFVIGGEDDDMGPQTLTVGTSTYSNTAFTGIQNKNTTANAWDGTTLTDNGDIHGLYIMNEGEFVPTLRMLNGENEGSVVNNSVLELGEE